MRKAVNFALGLTILLACVAFAAGQTTQISYQGSLKDAGAPASGPYDIEFRLFDSQTGGTQIVSEVLLPNVPVSEGVFSVALDFGAAAFPGADRFLEISVRKSGTSALATLTPRQKILSAPYAIQSLRAQTAANAQALNGIAASQYVLTNDPRLSGTNSAATFNVTNAYNANGNHLISAGPLLDNVFAGIGSGQLNLGNNNAFFGARAGAANKNGNFNSFFGSHAGESNVDGANNSFFGYYAGRSVTNANDNTFVGYRSGQVNTTGSNNSFMGSFSGFFNTTGSYNIYIGDESAFNANGSSNTFVGSKSGREVTTGSENTFLGLNAGRGSKTGSYNAFIGSNAGAQNEGGNYNSFVGTQTGLSNIASNNSFFGAEAGKFNYTGAFNTFVGRSAGMNTTTGELNTFIGSDAGNANTLGRLNTAVGAGANFTTTDLQYATAIGAGALATSSNSVVIGRSADAVRIPGSLTIGGAFSAGSINAASFIGILPSANGGTGMNSPGAAGNFLRSNGGNWVSSPLVAADIPAGSTNYIQNGTAQQASSNFNISGSGTIGQALSANSVNSATNYSISGTPILTANGAGNTNTLLGAGSGTAVGGLSYATAIGAGAVVPTSNTVVIGRSADTVRIPGNLTVNGTFTATTMSIPASSITGVLTAAQGGTGMSSSTGTNFLRGNGSGGWVSGPITSADLPSLGGAYIQNSTTQQTGNFNISGTGTVGGDLTVGGTLSANAVNSVTQYNIGGTRVFTTAGTSNIFVGAGTGTGGSSNAFFGAAAGNTNTSGTANTMIGANTDVSADGLTNATAIGANATVSQSNSLVLGAVTGTNGGTSVNVGIGTTAPKAKLEVKSGNIYLSDLGGGVILKSPDGLKCVLLSISNAGTPVYTAMTCP